MILTRSTLDEMTCDEPGCDHAAHDGLFLNPQCHTGEPVRVMYRAGVLHLSCGVCGAEMCDVVVAP